MKYEVIWNGISSNFDDYDEALDYCKTMTFEEDERDTALILSRFDDTVKIQALRWIIFGMFELVNLTV